MPNILFKLGGLDLSAFVRVNPGDGLDMGRGDMLQPGFSDSPFYEGQTFMSLNAKNKELAVPLFLHPSSSPYLQDGLNQLVQQVNGQLRLVTDLGLPLNVEWRNAQASSSTFFNLIFGRFEPNFNFRQTEKGWLAGVLHLWTLPYGHTATERSLGTYGATGAAMVVFPASMIAGAAGFPAASIAGDVSPQFDIRVTTGSYLADDGRVTIFSALPQPSYTPLVPIGQFTQITMALAGASGAYGSQALQSIAPDAFAVLLSPGSIYVGDHRIMGLVRAMQGPVGLRAFGPDGNPIGPTTVASAIGGWQLVDYGVLHAIPWVPTLQVTVKSYGVIPPSASGIFAPQLAAPQASSGAFYTNQFGPLFILPSDKTVVDLDYNSFPLAIDGFDQASGNNLNNQSDQLGNIWKSANGDAAFINGQSQLVASLMSGGGARYTVGSYGAGAIVMEAVMSVGSHNNGPGSAILALGRAFLFTGLSVNLSTGTGWLNISNASTSIASMALTAQPGVYYLKFSQNASQAYANIGGPSGSFPAAASSGLASIGGFLPLTATPVYMSFGFASSTGASLALEAFRMRSIASTGPQPRDIHRLAQPYSINSRQNPSAQDIFDLQSRARGAVAAPQLPPASLGAGFFCLTMPFDQGPANDVLNVDVRARERFTYAR